MPATFPKRPPLTCWIFQEGICDFRPFWICGHCKEKVRFPTMMTYSHWILEELIHVVWASKMSGRQDDMLSPFSGICILIIVDSIPHILIDIRPELLLVVANPIQFTLLGGSPCIHHILLKQLATHQKGRWFPRTSLKPECIIAPLADILTPAALWCIHRNLCMRTPPHPLERA